MSSMMRKCLLALIAAGGMLHLSAADAKTAVQVKDPTEAKEAEEKIRCLRKGMRGRKYKKGNKAHTCLIL